MLQHPDLVVPAHALTSSNLRFAMPCERTGEKHRQQHGNKKEYKRVRSKIVLEPLQYNMVSNRFQPSLIETNSDNLMPNSVTRLAEFQQGNV